MTFIINIILIGLWNKSGDNFVPLLIFSLPLNEYEDQ